MRAGKQTAICAHAINTAVLVQPHLGEHVPEELVVHNPEGGARSIDEACNCCIHISLGHCPFAGVHCQLCTQLNGHLLLLLMLLTCLPCSCPAASSLLHAALSPSERRRLLRLLRLRPRFLPGRFACCYSKSQRRCSSVNRNNSLKKKLSQGQKIYC